MSKRGSGILLPIFSLPGKYGIGGFSKEARDFVDFLKSAGQSYWQILPLGPTSYGDSPYQSFSTLAINPYFIDPEALLEKGLLKRSETKKLRASRKSQRIDYEWLYNTRLSGLRPASLRFFEKPTKEFEEFLVENKDWIYDYSLFMAIKNHFNDVSFENWNENIRRRDEDILSLFKEKLKTDIEFYEFLQYEAYSEWHELKKYANDNGIKIIGDIPIYVAYDSADVWAHPELFQMDENNNPTAVAGCPPDGFSEDGQLWGNPLYNWEYHKETGFDWWVRRIEKCEEMYDIIRIDHFRGFDEYYSVPYGDETARNGSWMKGPGIELFKAIEDKLGKLDIIAEDLGYITDTVKELVADTGFPNMKVLEFAFDSRDSSGPSLYLPHNYDKNCVVYTGTHDNETLYGWLNSIQPAELSLVNEYLGLKNARKDELTKRLIRLAHGSTANMCIIPIQDYLMLGNEARINHPSTLGGNWCYRMEGNELKQKLATEIETLTRIYGRNNIENQ